MKFTIAPVITLLAGGAVAFTNPLSSSMTHTALRMADVSGDAKSKSVPYLKKNKLLDGTMPGDVGFDPFFLADNPDLLYNYREAEVKHARLAMLAAAGWPISELLDRPLAKSFNMPDLLESGDRAPSVLNGGLGQVPISYWIGALLFASFVECAAIHKRRVNPDYFPGKLDFDPLGLYPKTEAGKKEMQLKEIKNGRLAMIAITAFAFQELVQQQGVVEQTPFFFKPPFF